ncbi:MAG TPA: CoA-binding protein, partial [Nitrososphaerales archaeon]|nr:CoA-binding protein [Nitrososphaerales archaeon]
MAGLSSFFAPSSVAVVGASEDLTKVASIIYDKLQRGVNEGYLKSEIFPINPHHSKVGGRPCYPNVTSLPKAPELLVIAVPVASTLRLVDEAARKGVKAIVIIAGGFGEAGRAGLEQDIAKAAKKEGIRILGPNTIGLLDTSSGMDTLFLPETKKLPDGREIASLLPPLKGGVVIVTQSGHLGEVVAEELRANFVGVRAIVGVGNQLDVSVEDVLEHFSDDKETKVIAVYLEGVKQGLRFLQKATHAAMKKPIIVFKTGKTEAGAKAAVTHTASMVGDYRVYQAAFRQSGLVEVQSLEELVDDCTAFAMQPEARGNRVAILTNAGGTGVMSADESARVGLHVGPLEKRLGGLLGKEFAASSFAGIISMSNPLDLTATAKTDEFIRAFDLLASSEDYDMILAFPTHQPATMDYAVVDRMTSIARDAKKPVVVGVMGRSELAEIFRTGFQSQGIPAYATPERCVRALRALAERRRLLKSLANPKCAAKKGLPWLDRHRGLLSPRLNERLLRAYGIPCAKSVLLRTRKDVNSVGQKLRFPLAVKLVSGGLAHKSDVGGVILNVKKDTDAASAYLKLRAVAKS